MNRLFAVRSQQISHIAGWGEIFDENLRPPMSVHAYLRDVNFRCLVWGKQDIVVRGVFLVGEICRVSDDRRGDRFARSRHGSSPESFHPE